MMDEMDNRIPNGLDASQKDRFMKAFHSAIAMGNSEAEALDYANESLITPEDRAKKIGELHG